MKHHTREAPQGQDLPHSWQIIHHIIEHVTLPIAQKMVLIVLADHANRERGWQAWPGLERLATMSSLHQSSVTRAIKELVATGIVCKERSHTVPSHNIYRLNVDAIFSMKSTVNAQESDYSEHSSRSSASIGADLDRALEQTIRLSGSGYSDPAIDEQANSTNTNTVGPCCAAVPFGMLMTISEGMVIYDQLPEILRKDLETISTSWFKNPKGFYREYVSERIAYRGTEDVNWTNTCFWTLLSCLRNKVKESITGWTVTVADHPENFEHLGDYSEEARNEAVRAYNEAKEAG